MTFPEQKPTRCLIFDGGHICRRLWFYPEAWSELPDLSLLEIMDRPR